MADVVRVSYILPLREDFEPCWPVLKSYLGENRPASTMIVAGLADPRMRLRSRREGGKLAHLERCDKMPTPGAQTGSVMAPFPRAAHRQK
jgi:hypothetical protein